MIRYLKYIFIPILCVLLMSHKVSAFSVNQIVDVVQTRNQPQVSFYNGSSWTTYQRGSITFNSSYDNFSLMRLAKSDFSSIDEFSLGDYVILKGSVSVNKVEFDNNFYTVGGFIGSISDNVNCSIIDLNFGAVQEYTTNTELMTRADFQLTCRVVTTAQYLTMNFRLNQDYISSVTGLDSILNISFDSATIATPNNIADKEQQATDNISNQSSSDIGSSDNGATTNLINALGGFITTIANAPATNCLINGDLGNLNIGSINLCTGKENFNTLVEFIGFTALFGVVFWAGYHLVKRTLSLIDWARSK